MLDFKLLDPRVTEEHLGLIPHFLWDTDPRPAAEQIDERYAHGGGWRPMHGFLPIGVYNFAAGVAPKLRYPGDPPFHPYAMATLHSWRHDELREEVGAEVFVIYEHAICAIFREGELYQVARLD